MRLAGVVTDSGALSTLLPYASRARTREDVRGLGRQVEIRNALTGVTENGHIAVPYVDDVEKRSTVSIRY